MKGAKCFTAVLACLMLFGIVSNIVYGLYQSPNPWSAWRYDQMHTGYTASAVTDRNETVWNAATNYYPTDTPIVVDGRVIFGGTGSRMYALDETTGVELWRSISLAGTLTGDPFHSGGRVFVGTSNGYLYCINATTGAKLWENQLTSSGQIQGAPTVANGKVFVTTTDNYLFGCDVSNGQYGVWYYQAGGNIYSSPAVSGNMVYFGCDDGKVYAMDASNPAGFVMIWRYTTRGGVRSSPCVANGKVFIGSSSNDHAIFALNATATSPNGQLIWKYTLDLGYSVDSTPTYHDGVVYFTFHSGKVYAVNANASPGNYTENQPGCKIWSQTIGTYGVGSNSLTVAGDKVLAASDQSSRVYCMNSTNGQVIWYSHLASTPYEPIVADGNVFVCDVYTIYCIGDYYPPVTYYYTVTPPGAGGASYGITLVVANATPSQTITTQLLVSYKKISYNVTGIDGTMGMSNITLPDEMLGGPYTVRINGGLITSPLVVDDGTYSSIYFTYSQSLNNVEITGTSVVPEFSQIIVLPSLIAMLFAAIALARRKTRQK